MQLTTILWACALSNEIKPTTDLVLLFSNGETFMCWGSGSDLNFLSFFTGLDWTYLALVFAIYLVCAVHSVWFASKASAKQKPSGSPLTETSTQTHS